MSVRAAVSAGNARGMPQLRPGPICSAQAASKSSAGERRTQENQHQLALTAPSDFKMNGVLEKKEQIRTLRGEKRGRPARISLGHAVQPVPPGRTRDGER